MAQHCAAMLDGHSLGRLLDAGGGEGLLVSYLIDRLGERAEGESSTVLDRDLAALARVRPPFRTLCADLEELSAEGTRYTTILVRQVLHYLHEPERVLRTLSARLAPGGLLYVGQMVATDPESADWLATTANWCSPSRLRVWTAEKLLDAFATTGLRPERLALVPYWQRLSATGGLGHVYWLHAALSHDPRTASATDDRQPLVQTR